MKLNSRFDAQLEDLRKEVLTLSDLCRDALLAITDALAETRLTRADDVQRLSDEINQGARRGEGLCLQILLQRHPVASDLRRVSSALKMMTDFQRIGHQAADVAEIILTEEVIPVEEAAALARTCTDVVAMLEAMTEAYRRTDPKAARQVMQSDDAIDAAYSQMRAHLLDKIRQREVKNPTSLLNALMLAKYFERMGDHIVHLARWVVFLATGELQEKA